MNIGERIKTARKKAGLTQAQLAEKTGVATITIRQYELGKRQPRIEQLRKIASALGLYISDLVEGEQWKQFSPEELMPEERLAKVASENLPPTTVKAGWKSVPTNQNRTRMNAAFDQLNPEGQAVAADQVENLTYNPKYQKKESE